MTLLVAPLVEGLTEVRCIERLLQRVWVEVLMQTERLQVVPAIWVKRDQVIKPGRPELAEAIGQAAQVLATARARAGPDARSLILLMIDAEGDCPATLAPQLLTRTARPDVDVDCVLPKRMLENWFVASLASLQAAGMIPPASQPPPAGPEECHGANWLDAQIRAVSRGTYSKVADGLRFTRAVDLAACRAASPSFDKLCRVLAARLPPAPPPNPDADASGS